MSELQKADNEITSNLILNGDLGKLPDAKGSLL